MKKILIIASHPDDEVLGCGGVIALACRKGYSVRVVFLAEGVSARYNEEEFSSNKVIAEIDKRNKNAYKALDLLGVSEKEIFTSNRYCCRLDTLPQIELVKDIENHIEDFKPNMVFTHSGDDVNMDHRVSFMASLAALRPIKSQSVSDFLTFEVLSSSEWNTLNPFKPNYFVDITEVLEIKINAMQLYDKEVQEYPHSRSPEMLTALAKYRGSQSYFNAAEAFYIVRKIKNSI
ncbi:MAG: hypothetical protein CFH01_00535 [Alphaproteobacteria bacterium MarineAlpha2_Bin1]|nr:MAG: hypothetical protein CFH01_00535 [Alphaproteobacteria bacterium MarineAlpha2_Bin1]|tara:strand:- start:1394 stop:2092 length:699 start_codon:yes stop_codon:yes gene_type:complete